MDIKNFLEKGREQFLPNLSIDIVIIGYEAGRLKCLLLESNGKWMLPGGYIPRDVSIEKAAQDILKQRTNLEDPHLEFLSIFGRADRKFTTEWKTLVEGTGMPWNPDYWINDRFVTLAYYSLVDIEKTHPAVHQFDTAFGWFDFDALPEMWMDHKEIVLTARHRLKEDIQHQHLTYNLLPEPFTMPVLHQLHQTILQEEIDRSRFQKKMLASGLFERLPKLQKETPGRNPFQYRVKK